MANYKVLLIESNYTAAMHLREMIPWEELGYSLVTEYYELAASAKLSSIQPDILIVGSIQNLSNIQQYLDIIRERRLGTRVIILINTETQWKTLNNGKIDSFLSLPTMTPDELISALRHSVTADISSAPVFRWYQWNEADIPSFLNALPENQTGWYLAAAYIPDGSDDNTVNSEKLSRTLKEISQGRIRMIAADRSRFLTAFENPSVSDLEPWLKNIFVSISEAVSQYAGNRKATLFVSGPSDKTKLFTAYEKMMEMTKYYYFISDMSVVSKLPKPVFCSGQDITELCNRLLSCALKSEEPEVVNIVSEIYCRKIAPALSRSFLEYGRACIERVFSILGFLWHTDMHPCSAAYKASTIYREAEIVSSFLLSAIRQYNGRLDIRPRVLEALIFMINNHSQDVSLMTVSEYTGINSSYLSRIFKEDTGIGISDCLNKLRIADAKCLMHLSDQNISRIAQSSGFWNVKYFSKIFKNFEGVTPSEYLRESRRQKCITNLCSPSKTKQ